MKLCIPILVFTLSTGLSACGNPQPSDNVTKTITTKITPRLFTEYSLDEQDAFKACGVDEAEYYRLMDLSYKDFDQDFKGGWRQISYKEGCHVSAARLLKSYTANSRYEFESNHSTLRWHTGQVLAGSGNYDEALTFFKRTYKEEDGQEDWNLYVEGTIAFLEKDKAALEAARDELATIPVPEKLKEARRKFLKDNPNITMPEGFIDEPGNLSVLDKLIKCFDEPYSVAYGACKK